MVPVDDNHGTEPEIREWRVLWRDTDFSKVILGEDGPHQGKPEKFHHKLNNKFNRGRG